jgi:hypothetical protein
MQFQPHPTGKRFFTPRELADRWRMDGAGPAYLKIGGRVLYDIAQIGAHERSRGKHRLVEWVGALLAREELVMAVNRSRIRGGNG